MASREKAELKAAMADEIVKDLEAMIATTENKDHGARAVVDCLDSLLMFCREYRGRIDAAFDDGTFPMESRDAVLGVFSDIVSAINKRHRLAVVEQRAISPFVLGLRKAEQLVRNRKRGEIARAEQTAREEAEDDEWRSDGDTEPTTGDAPEEADADDEQSHDAASEPVAETSATVTEDADDAQPYCTHCGTLVTMSTGSSFCSACISYRNRYGGGTRLPPEHVLEARRARADS